MRRVTPAAPQPHIQESWSCYISQARAGEPHVHVHVHVVHIHADARRCQREIVRTRTSARVMRARFERLARHLLHTVAGARPSRSTRSAALPATYGSGSGGGCQRAAAALCFVGFFLFLKSIDRKSVPVDTIRESIGTVVGLAACARTELVHPLRDARDGSRRREARQEQASHASGRGVKGHGGQGQEDRVGACRPGRPTWRSARRPPSRARRPPSRLSASLDAS